MLARFLDKVQLIPFHECWEWDAATDTAGYGRFYYQGKVTGAHQYAYLVTYGETSQYRVSVVLHTCDNPSCVNPAHLELGSYADNTKDMMNKGRCVPQNSLKTHCNDGHAFTEDNIYRRNSSNSRECLTCKRSKR